MKFPVLSVIIPAYNEEKRIGACLDVLFAYLPLYLRSWEVIVVDDGSTDATWSILEHYKSIFHDLNIVRNAHSGKGLSVRTGMLFATGEYRLFMDVDLSTPVSEISNALIAIEHVATAASFVRTGQFQATHHVPTHLFLVFKALLI